VFSYRSGPRFASVLISNVILDSRFTQPWLWRTRPPAVWYRVVRQKFTDVSKEHTVSIFSVEDLFLLIDPEHENSTMLRNVVNLYRTTRRHIPEESTSILQEHYSFNCLIFLQRRPVSKTHTLSTNLSAPFWLRDINIHIYVHKYIHGLPKRMLPF
jgi:hypothetical protein